MDKTKAKTLYRRGLRPTAAKLVAMAREILRLRKRVAKLQTLLEEAKRAAKRQAAPFSRGEPKTHPRTPGRKPGRAYGRKAHRPIPNRVDETLDAPLPNGCPHCGGPIELCRVATQYQADLPPIRPRITRFNVQVGRCRNCRRRVQGRHPKQVSDALGAAASHLGPNALALAAKLNKELGLAWGKVQDIFARPFQLPVTRGGLAQAMHRLARKLTPTYKAMTLHVRNSPVVSADETGWRVGGLRHWLHAFATLQVTVYIIRTGRGFPEASEVLGKGYAGVLQRDGWAPYRRFLQALHQTCLQHLDRRARELIDAAERGQAKFPHAVLRILRAALDLRDRRDDDSISPHGLLVALGRLEVKTDRILAGRIAYEPNRVFAKHLRNEREALFTFLKVLGVEATNWMGEHAMRPAVVNRKVWGGNRTQDGARAQEVLTSFLRTCRQQQCDPCAVLRPILLSQAPLIANLRLAAGLSPPS